MTRAVKIRKIFSRGRVLVHKGKCNLIGPDPDNGFSCLISSTYPCVSHHGTHCVDCHVSVHGPDSVSLQYLDRAQALDIIAIVHTHSLCHILSSHIAHMQDSYLLPI